MIYDLRNYRPLRDWLKQLLYQQIGFFKGQSPTHPTDKIWMLACLMLVVLRLINLFPGQVKRSKYLYVFFVLIMTK